jgi:phytoene synthase
LHRGQAFQRTNILRDFCEDYDAVEGPRRVYIPREAFERHGVSPEQLRNWRPALACGALIREQASMAREHYLLSAELESMIDPACAPTLWAMTRIYSGLLEQVEGDPARIVGDRVRLTPAAKATIAIRAAIGARTRRW